MFNWIVSYTVNPSKRLHRNLLKGICCASTFCSENFIFISTLPFPYTICRIGALSGCSSPRDGVVAILTLGREGGKTDLVRFRRREFALKGYQCWLYRSANSWFQVQSKHAKGNTTTDLLKKCRHSMSSIHTKDQMQSLGCTSNHHRTHYLDTSGAHEPVALHHCINGGQKKKHVTPVLFRTDRT